MDVTSLYITDNNFDQKIKELKTMLRLRMNGETSTQMKKRNLKYTLNYGVSLPHIKEIAGKVSFTPDECKKLWLMNIRETMLLACMLMPQSAATLDEMTDWAQRIETSDMAEQASFFLFGRLEIADKIATTMLNATHTYAYAITYFTAGRALQMGININNDTAKEIISRIKDTKVFNTAEARGLSLLLRQIIRHKRDLIDDVNRVLENIKNSGTEEAQRLVYEVETEKKMYDDICSDNSI